MVISNGRGSAPFGGDIFAPYIRSQRIRRVFDTIFLRRREVSFLSNNFNDFEITKWANGPDWALRARRPGHGCYKVTKVARKANPMN